MLLIRSASVVRQGVRPVHLPVSVRLAKMDIICIIINVSLSALTVIPLFLTKVALMSALNALTPTV